MIAVIDVKIVKVPENFLMIHSLEPMLAEWADHSERADCVPVKTENIVGERFVCNGQDVVIGMSQAVQDAIGLPMRVFSDMNREVECTRRENGMLSSTCYAWEGKFHELQEATFWDRLVWLFKGVM